MALEFEHSFASDRGRGCLIEPTSHPRSTIHEHTLMDLANDLFRDGPDE
jgi:hypothetical protein